MEGILNMENNVKRKRLHLGRTAMFVQWLSHLVLPDIDDTAKQYERI